MKFNVTVINVNYNSELDCVKYVTNLKSQKKINLNVVIVDNNSPDESGIRLKNKYNNDQNVTVILSKENSGFARGNNAGLKAVTDDKCKEEEYIVISNNDIELLDDLLIFTLIKKLINAENAAFISPVMKLDNQIAATFAARDRSLFEDILILTPLKYLLKPLNYKVGSEQSDLMKVDSLPGAFFIGKASIWKKIGFFDEVTFLYGEERILGRKVKEFGYVNYISTNNYFQHEESKIVSKEFNSLQKRKLMLHGRVAYHELYNPTRKIQIYVLKLCHALYLKLLCRK
jgi:GT2 family glycosyltransferase